MFSDAARRAHLTAASQQRVGNISWANQNKAEARDFKVAA
jgi:hypothetical protein